MGVTTETLNRAIAAARAREAQGYFKRVRDGDQRAASLFVKLVALDCNPSGIGSDYGWLSKSPGEQQVDGFAEDAICYGVDPSDLQNVVDLISGAGAPGASIGGAVKERRPHNKWVKPTALTDEEMDYLLDGAEPVPTPPTLPGYEAFGGDEAGKRITRQLEADYREAGRAGLDGNCGAWVARCYYDYVAGQYATVDEAIADHRPEWRAALGLA